MTPPAQSDYLDELAHFATHTRLEDVADSALAYLRAIIADTLAACAAGNREPEMRALLKKQLPQVAAGRASVFGSAKRMNPQDAAALNAAAGCWLELDEGNLASNGHPGIQVLPSAMAVAQQLGASGEQFLLASALGYEICARIGSACDMRMSIHPHGTYGVVGAAVATARLAGLDPRRMRELINLAASSPIAGNRQSMKDGATLRNWYASHSALMGQMAVRLIDAGFTGPIDGIKPTCDDVLFDNFRPQEVVRDLGRRWLLADGYIKLYSCGRPIHAAIDALRMALAKTPVPVRPEDVERIEVRAFKFVVFLNRTDIRNAFATRFSTPFALAAITAKGSHGLECFTAATAADPVINALARKVEMTEVPEYSAEFPRKQLCDVAVLLKDGTRLDGHCKIIRGEPANPADPAEVADKYFAIARPIWGERLAGEVYTDVMRVEKLASLRDLAGGADL
ncbi:MAG: MmgE/PrpD family protein [Burkholderiales bacterium]|nr:MmgE/PrpD family protein [Burkholderiales bacterium]